MIVCLEPNKQSYISEQIDFSPSHAPSGRIKLGDLVGYGSLIIKLLETLLFFNFAKGEILTCASLKLFKRVVFDADFG